jgi:hypothetical protein
MSKNQEASEAGRALGKLGASKGGLERARALTAEQRKEIASRAAQRRWETTAKGSVHKATHIGVLPIGDIPCAVLEDGTRVLSERGIMKALGGKRGGSHWRRRKSEGDGADLPVYLSARNLTPYIDGDLSVALKSPLLVQWGGSIANGINAALLPEICGVYLKTRDAGKLHKTQHKIAFEADLLIRALAHVGIVALVDEATGYQADRAKDALTKILNRFIAKELRKWVKTFPDDFYREMFRLRGWNYSDLTSTRPQVVAHYTMDIVYARLAPGVRQELKRLTPRDDKGRLKNKLFQRLSEEVGHPKLREHLAAVVALEKAATTWDGFIRMLDRALPRYGDSLPLPFEGQDP